MDIKIWERATSIEGLTAGWEKVRSNNGMAGADGGLQNIWRTMQHGFSIPFSKHGCLQRRRRPLLNDWLHGLMLGTVFGFIQSVLMAKNVPESMVTGRLLKQ